jgi:alpha-beta hydrolase superfamily lysophospholipase
MQIADIAQDDMLWKGSIRVCTGCSMLEGFAGVKALWPDMSLPLLALHGGEDAVCPIEYVREMMASVPTEDKTLKEFPDALHDLEHDFVKFEWRDTVSAWIEERL